jgi:hypothetical protein
MCLYLINDSYEDFTGRDIQQAGRSKIIARFIPGGQDE